MKRHLPHLLLPLALIAALPAGAEIDPPRIDPALLDPDLLDLVFADARADCAEQGGTLALPETLRAEAADLTGDGRPDLILSEEGAFCGPDLGFVGGGSAGAQVHVLIGQQVQSLLPGNWMVTDLQFPVEGELLPPTRVLLMAVHGGFCDSFGAAPCFVAFAWDGARMVSVLDGAALWGAAPHGEP